jgi:hypothetical protein
MLVEKIMCAAPMCVHTYAYIDTNYTEMYISVANSVSLYTAVPYWLLGTCCRKAEHIYKRLLIAINIHFPGNVGNHYVISYDLQLVLFQMEQSSDRLQSWSKVSI